MTSRRPVEDLYIHPFNLEIYGEPDDGLADSLESFGLQHPISVDPDGGILSGARRWTAAKALGWDNIETTTPDIDYGDHAEVEKYVLIANAYRKQKTSYQQKREADAYYRLLCDGDVTKKELDGVVQQRDRGLPKGYEDEPMTLAAAAAGLGRTTYKSYRYFDDGIAEDSVRESYGNGEISEAQRDDLLREIDQTADRVRSDEQGPGDAYKSITRKVREAKKEKSYTEEQRRTRDAHAAATTANKAGKSFLNALARLRADGHTEHLDERHALMLVNTVSEIVELIGDIQSDDNHTDNRIEVGHTSQLRAS